MGDPRIRMRRERRMALLFFNLFLLVAALLQWWAYSSGPWPASPEPQAFSVEVRE